MTKIKTSANQASKQASAILQGLAQLKTSPETKDQTSLLQGNEEAKASIDKAATYASQIKEKSASYVQLIHSVHSDFQAMDSQLKQNIDQRK